ncbi:hypothetical protein ACWELQ_39965, partial [Nocardia sp. NPDC004722]
MWWEEFQKMRVWSAMAGIVAMVGAVLAAPAAHAQTGSGNLIVNGNAEAGYCTTDWNAATTLPGWSITAGSPDVICSSAGSFSYPSGSVGKAFFAPGNQGDGAIAQTVNVASAASAIDGGGVTYTLDGWLGGWGSYAGLILPTLTQHGERGLVGPNLAIRRGFQHRPQ